MKRHTLAKFELVRNRTRDLKARFKKHLSKPEGHEDRQIPRVAAVVLSEGTWVCNLCRRMLSKYKDVKAEKESLDALTAAEKWFRDQINDYGDEAELNLFIPEMDAVFITHLETAVVLAQKIDAQVQAKLANTLGNYDLEDDETPQRLKGRKKAAKEAAEEWNEEETADV